MIKRMVETGFKKIEATSFAPPRYLPQFADAEEVLKGIPRKEGVDYRAICATLKAVERAVKSKEEGFGVQELAMVLAASEAYNQVNVHMTREENMKVLEPMVRKALDTGHVIIGWVLTSFGCPLTGDVPLEEVARIGKWWKEMGARFIGFGDTTGSSNPKQVGEFFEFMLNEGFTTEEVIVHFHDTRGWGIANSLTALTFGFRYLDTSLGAVGGQPKTQVADYHLGYGGNTCTEDLVGMLEEMGIRTDIDLRSLLETGRRAEEILGRRLRSNFLYAGPVPHKGIHWDPSKGILGLKS